MPFILVSYEIYPWHKKCTLRLYSCILNILCYDFVALEISPYELRFMIYVIRISESITEAPFD
jgi:hypothetical protein